LKEQKMTGQKCETCWNWKRFKADMQHDEGSPPYENIPTSDGDCLLLNEGKHADNGRSCEKWEPKK
jgi:hypothetical protein